MFSFFGGRKESKPVKKSSGMSIYNDKIDVPDIPGLNFMNDYVSALEKEFKYADTLDKLSDVYTKAAKFSHKIQDFRENDNKFVWSEYRATESAFYSFVEDCSSRVETIVYEAGKKFDELKKQIDSNQDQSGNQSGEDD